MKIKYAIAALAATTMLSGAALADGPKNKHRNHHQNRSAATAVTGGVAAANRRGAVAGGVSAAQSMRGTTGRRGSNMTNPGAVSTSTTGAVYTSRRSGSAAINTNAAATGDGTLRANSEGEVYSTTDRQGSDADAYGNSSATVKPPKL